MIANLSIDIENMEDSISTARFSQRCSKLENEVLKNKLFFYNIYRYNIYIIFIEIPLLDKKK